MADSTTVATVFCGVIVWWVVGGISCSEGAKPLLAFTWPLWGPFVVLAWSPFVIARLLRYLALDGPGVVIDATRGFRALLPTARSQEDR